MSAKASGASPKDNANGSARDRNHHDGSSGRAFTAEQKSAVLRVRKCSPTAFYDILGLESEKKTADESAIKKAYRKCSLLTHPDKNGYEGADEAFKMVSRAFQILSDADKKRQYDQTGGDPDNRFASASTSSPFSSFARSPGAGRGGSMFEEEMSPEDLFRQFFGGGMGGGFGGPFGGGIFDNTPGFVFNMGGGPGVRVHQFGGNRPRRRPPGAPPANETPLTARTALQNLLPLLILFILPLFSSIFSGFSSTSQGPHFEIDTPTSQHTYEHISRSLKVPYYVNPTEVEEFTARKWRDLDRVVEETLVGRLNAQCDVEYQQRERAIRDAHGWFFPDQEALDRARRMELTSCNRLRALGRM